MPRIAGAAGRVMVYCSWRPSMTLPFGGLRRREGFFTFRRKYFVKCGARAGRCCVGTSLERRMATAAGPVSGSLPWATAAESPWAFGGAVAHSSSGASSI